MARTVTLDIISKLRQWKRLPPPTDSLYKFLAIFGIVLLLAGYYAEYRAQNDYWDAMLDYFESVPDPDGTVNELREQLIQGDFASAKTPIPDGDAMRPFLSLVLRERDLPMITSFSRQAVGLGKIFIVVGFITWWFRVQRHVDTKLRCAALLAKATLSLQTEKAIEDTQSTTGIETSEAQDVAGEA